MIIPAHHLPVLVDGDIGSKRVVVGAKVAVWSTKPLIKALLQRQILWSVAQMPVVTNNVHSNTVRAK